MKRKRKREVHLGQVKGVRRVHRSQGQSREGPSKKRALQNVYQLPGSPLDPKTSGVLSRAH